MDINELDSYRLSDAVKFHTELNPALWDGDRMRPEVREALIKIADDFREFLGISDLAVEDITVSGSNAAYTYTPHSDIDLHLLVDFSKLNPDQVYQELFNAKKYQYNDQHDIKIRGYDVELYVQDAGKPVRSLGEYSIVRDDWTRIPVRRQGNLDEKSTQAKYEKLRDLIELALTSDDLQTVTNLTDVIKRYRQAGLDEHGEFGPENLAYKILRTQGLVKRLFDHRASLEDSKLSLAERRKKKKKSKKKFRYGSFGGYYYPGYGYYGQTGDAEAADGGGDGGGESMREDTEIKVQAKSIPIDKVVRRFVHFAAHYLKLDQLPRIILQGEKLAKHIHSMGHYVDDKKMIEVATHGRHIMDILRTVAHELTHYKQHERLGQDMPDTAGRTGSAYENEANAKAGIIMRHFQNRYPEFFGAETVEEGIGKTLATGALAAAAALGQPAQAQDVGRTAYQIGKQIYQPSGIFTRAGAEEELKGIARDMARGSREIRVGGKLIYGGPRPQGERVASNAAAASAEEAYRQALENAINRAQQQHGPITLGPGGWKVVDYEADQLGNTFRAMVAIEGPAPRRESIQTPVSRSQKDREDYYKFVMGKATTGRPLTRLEQEFIKTYRLQQKLQSKVAEDAAGYIPTKKQARDPRFKTALTVDVRPGQVGKEANKLGLQTDSQGRPAMLIKNLANALKEYKDTGVFEAVNPVTPAVPDPRQKIDPYQGQGQKRQTPQDRPKKKTPPGTGNPRFVNIEVKEDEDLMEVKMSPGALEAWARSPEAEGIRAGFEAEMIFRDTRRDEDENYDQEPDYDYDERPDDIDHVIDFFSNDDYGYGLSRQGARNLRESLWEAYTEWVDEKISESWDENAEDQVRDYMETNVWNDDSERESRIRDVLIDLDVDDIEAVMAAGEAAPRFTRSSDQNEYARSNELYQRFIKASDAALEAFEEEITNEFESQGEYYDAAREYYVDMTREGGEFDERDFLRDRYGYMTDIANEESLDWPYWSGGESGTGSREWSDIGDSLQRAIDMPVRVSSGYHSTTRRPGLWIIEPDGSLDPDDRDDEMGLEIVSPPLPLPETLEKLKQVLEWGNSEANAYTNSSTGLHMGISIPYVGGDVDYVKLVLFMGDEYVLDKFGRASNTYAASAMEKLRNSMQVARRRGTLTEARFDPMGALELVQKNLIELAARYVQNGVGTSKYTSAHIQDGYIEFRSPGGDYLSVADRGEEEDIRNTMLRFARAMQIAGSPSLERREYAKKLYKLISPGAQDDGLKLFSQFAAGTITPEELKKQWANAVLQKEIPTTGQEEWEVYNMGKQGPESVIDSFYADEYDTAYMKAQDKYGNTPEWRQLDIRKKQPWFDVFDPEGNIVDTLRARDGDQAQLKAKSDHYDDWTDAWRVYRRPDDTPDPEKKLSPRAQVAKRLKEPKVPPTVAADNERDREQIQARIGEPQPAGAVGDTGHYRVMWDERRNGTTTSDSLNIDAASAEAARQNVLDALQMQGRDVIQISAYPQQPPAWRRNQEPVATSTQGEFSGQWQVRNANTGEVVYTFSGIGNNQGDANRVAQQWVQRTRFDDPVEVVPELR